MDNVGADIKENDSLPYKDDRSPYITPSPHTAGTEAAMTKENTENSMVLYKRRWLILGVFSLITMMNEVIWISLSSVSSILQSYYGVGYNSINWLAMIFSTMYVSVILSVFLLNKYGLKVTIVGGAFCNTAASVFRLVGYRRNGFVFAFIGNAFGGIGQAFLIFIPPTLSSVWFGEKERARASAIGMLMNMLGVAVGFLMGSLFVPNSTDYDGAVQRGMFTTLLIQAVVCGVLLIASIIFIRKAPTSPPTHSQALNIERRNTKRDIRRQSKAGGNLSSGGGNLFTNGHASPNNNKEMVLATSQIGHANCQIQNDVIEVTAATTTAVTQSTGFFKNWKFLITSLPFHLLTHAYGLYFGLFVTVSTLLNQMTTQHFPGRETLIGMMGFTSVLFGLVAIMLAGLWIDKTHRYKFLSVGIWISCVTSFLLFVVVLKYGGNFPLTFVCFSLYGFCSYPYLSVGLEFIAELLYPIKESILSFILLFVGSLYGTVFTYAAGILIDKFGADVAGYVTTSLYFVGLVCVVCVKGELKRYNIDKSRNT